MKQFDNLSSWVSFCKAGLMSTLSALFWTKIQLSVYKHKHKSMENSILNFFDLVGKTLKKPLTNFGISRNGFFLKTATVHFDSRPFNLHTLISKNQGFEKSRSISNPRKKSGLQTLIFLQVSTLKKGWVYAINLKAI